MSLPSCMKTLFYTYNVLFSLLVGLIQAASFYLIWNVSQYIDSNGYYAQYTATIWFMVPLSGVVLIWTIFGTISIVKWSRNSRMPLRIHTIMCLFLCLLIGATLSWTLENERSFLEKTKRETVRRFKLDYGRSNETELLVDRIQGDFGCCGLHDATDWTLSYLNQNDESIFDLSQFQLPHSCCKPRYTGCLIEVERIDRVEQIEKIEGLYLDGCANKLEVYIRQIWTFIQWIELALLGGELIAFLLACIMCCCCCGVFEPPPAPVIKRSPWL